MDHREYLHLRLGGGTKGEEEFLKARDLENKDRADFARTRDGWEILGREDLSIHPHRSLVPVFDCLEDFRIDAPSEGDGDPDRRAFPLNREERASLTRQSSVVPSLTDFRSTFLDVFAEGQLRYLNWDNVFAAGGGVMACLQPVPDEFATSVTRKRKYFHDVAYGASDIDLFLYGLTEEQAKRKLKEIYASVCESCPFPVVAFRSAHAVTLVSRYPFRHIQIVLRLYSSPYEVLAGFDVDACTVGFDGMRVYADVRAHHALVTRRNTVDVTRRSPSYEMRLAKYGKRGFEVELKDLKRERVDPGIFERPWRSLDGLAKLLVLEKLQTPEQRAKFFEMQKLARAAGAARSGYYSRSTVDVAMQERLEDMMAGTAEVSNYSTVFLPWGPEYTSDSAMRLMAKKDKKLNSSWFSRNRPYRLHPCFFGTMEEVLGDCSADDPPFPEKKDDEEEDAVLKEHREAYVRGSLTFLSDNPGRQRIGSFHPLDEAGWADGVYFEDTTEALFRATNANDAVRVQEAIKNCASPDVRDFFGRTALHLSVMCGAESSMKVLLQAGASPLECLAGGRTVFHLAALYNRTNMISPLRNAAEAKFQGEHVPGATKPKTATKQLVRCLDGDVKGSAFQFALTLGNFDTAGELLAAGATFTNAEVAEKGGNQTNAHRSPVEFLTNNRLEEGIEFLVKKGWSSASRVPEERFNTIHSLCGCQDDSALKIILEKDPAAVNAMNALTQHGDNALGICFRNGSAPSFACAKLLLETKKCEVVPSEKSKADLRAETQLANESYPVECYSRNQTIPFPIILAKVLLIHVKNLWDARLSRARAKQAKERTDEALDVVKLCFEQLPQDHPSRTEKVTPSSIYHLRNFLGHHNECFDDSFFHERGHDENQPAAVTLKEFLAWYVGAFLNSMEDAEDDKEQEDEVGVSLSLFSSIAEELETYCHPVLRDMLEGWKAAASARNMSDLSKNVSGTQAENSSSEEDEDEDEDNGPFSRNVFGESNDEKDEGKETLTDAEKEALKAETQKAVEDYLTSVRGVISYSQELANAAAAKCKSLRRKRTFGYGYGMHYDNAQSDVKTKGFPTVASLFPTKPEEDSLEFPAYKFLHQAEVDYPVPDPLPSKLKEHSDEKWCKAALQRSLYKLLARNFKEARFVEFLQDWCKNEIVLHNRESRVKAVDARMASSYIEILSAIRGGEVDSLKNMCDRNDCPVSIVSPEGTTCLTEAILFKNVPAIYELVRLAKLQHVKRKKPKRGKAPGRINNLELLQEMDECHDDGEIRQEMDECEDDGEDSGDDDDSEGSGGDDNDDNDGDVGDNDDDDDEEIEEKAKSSEHDSASNHPGSSVVDPSVLFRMCGHIYLKDEASRLATKVCMDEHSKKKELLAYSSHTFHSNRQDVKVNTHFVVTPLQLAVILGDIALVEAILSAAAEVSPQLPYILVLHDVIYEDGFSTFQLAIALDFVDAVRLMLRATGGSLAWSNLSMLFKLPQFQPNLDFKETKTKSTRAITDGYSGLQSCLFGEWKRQQESKQNPRLARIELLPPPPGQTLLSHTAGCGAVNCFKAFAQPRGVIFDDIKSFLSHDCAQSIRTLLEKSRERTPKAFEKFYSCDDTLGGDTAVVMHFLVGSDIALKDSLGMSAIHYAIEHNRLSSLLKGGIIFPPEVLNAADEVSAVDKVAYPCNNYSCSTTGGIKYRFGGSPLMAAAKHGMTNIVQELIDIGADPNKPDPYYSESTPFHLALSAMHFTTAKHVAEKMDPCVLLRPNSAGITPLMTAASLGIVDALLAAIPACANIHPKGTIFVKDFEGRSPIHFAANTRFVKVLRTLVDWANESTTATWNDEDYNHGKTPLEIAISSHTRNSFREVRNRNKRFSRRSRCDDSTQQRKKKMRGKAIPEKLGESIEIVESVWKGSSAHPRTLAAYESVRPVRERCVADVAGETGSGGGDDFLQKAYSDAWGEARSLYVLSGLGRKNSVPRTVFTCVLAQPVENPVERMW